MQLSLELTDNINAQNRVTLALFPLQQINRYKFKNCIFLYLKKT